MTDEELGAAVRQLVEVWLAWHEQLDRRERHHSLHAVVDGKRLVDGGSLAGGTWEVTDATTGEVLATGRGRASYDDAWQDGWVHVDTLDDDAYSDVTEPSDTFGLPVQLVDTLTTWVIESPDEARQLAGRQG